MPGLDNRSSEMQVFVTAVERGGFSAAGRSLGLSPSAVSKLVARLERRLRVPLLVRSTRALALTPEGEDYYRRCARILVEMDDAERLASRAAVPSGLLRVNTSQPFGSQLLVPLLPDFLTIHPKIVVDLSLTDDVVDLMEERADVAIRIGPLRDSSLRARKLGDSRSVVVGAPSYLARYGAPTALSDLSTHNCLGFNFHRTLGAWRFAEGVVGRPLGGNIQVTNGETLRQLVLAGVGLARLAQFHVQADIEQGRLVPLLCGLTSESGEEVHALFIGHAHLASRVRAFVDFLVERVGPRLRGLDCDAAMAQ